MCLFVDEMQYLETDEIAALIGALHRCNQLRFPVMMFCAGLPKIKKLVGDAKTYSERLFAFEEVGALDAESAKSVVVGPAEAFDVHFSEEAVEEILRVTGKYPYFLQEMCSTVWNATLHLGCCGGHAAYREGNFANSWQVDQQGPDFATGYAEIDFTVPQFDAFLIRQNPTLHQFQRGER